MARNKYLGKFRAIAGNKPRLLSQCMFLLRCLPLMPFPFLSLPSSFKTSISFYFCPDRHFILIDPNLSVFSVTLSDLLCVREVCVCGKDDPGYSLLHCFDCFPLSLPPTRLPPSHPPPSLVFYRIQLRSPVTSLRISPPNQLNGVGGWKGRGKGGRGVNYSFRTIVNKAHLWDWHFKKTP